MTNIGNIDYKQIKDRQFMTVDTDRAAEIISRLNEENIRYAGRFDDKRLQLNFSKDDWKKVNDIISSVPESVKEKEVENNTEKALGEIRQLLKEMQERQEKSDYKTEKLNKGNEEPEEKPTQSEQQSEPTEVSVNDDTDNITYSDKLLPILNAKVIKHSQRLDSLAEKRATREDKIAKNQDKIEKLTSKAERLEDTNQMLKQLFANVSMPGITALAESTIDRNAQKIAKIRNERIPNRENKIEKHSSAIAEIDRKSEVTQCKIDRCRNLSSLIKSFAVLNPEERRKQFTAAMDGLNKTTVQSLNLKIEKCGKQISNLTKRYMETEGAADRLSVQHKLNDVKKKKLNYTEKLNKLNGVTKPYAKQSDIIVDNIIDKTAQHIQDIQETVSITTDKLSLPAIVENVCVNSAVLVPEVAFTVPEKTPDSSLLPEIAEVLGKSVSELENKPQDIKNMLIEEYTANYFTDPATLRENLLITMDMNTELSEDNYFKSAEDQRESNYDSVDDKPPKSEQSLNVGVTNKVNDKQKEFSVSRKHIQQTSSKVSSKPAANHKPPQANMDK